MTSPSQTTTAEYFDEYWRGSSGWTPTDSLDRELKTWMGNLVAPGRKLLDVGCGDGSRYAAHLAASGVELHGVRRRWAVVDALVYARLVSDRSFL